MLGACTAALSQPGSQYTLANTEVLSLSATELKRDYVVFISLPASYRTSNKRYPVVFVTDAKDLKANGIFAVGALETGAGRDDLMGDLKQFEVALKSRRYPGLRIQSKVLADEDHLSVAPMIMTRGLKWALPGSDRKR